MRGMSDKPKWTPGPWEAYDRAIGWEIHAAGREINDGHRDTFREADAHLIAAAPDLYEALHRIVSTMNDDDDGMRLDLGLAHAALKKARGN